eukprot:TRINITY_DN2225_c0_g1_i5.p1 TRINITY_DN2225_c0_g1~~TRINITY_DN2225_c0_g1_i5.p1  ORF type:complete len:456 (+),score=45.90 TRINITY_DN2225_c0_g1_i5:75-1442(+)
MASTEQPQALDQESPPEESLSPKLPLDTSLQKFDRFCLENLRKEVKIPLDEKQGETSIFNELVSLSDEFAGNLKDSWKSGFPTSANLIKNLGKTEADQRKIVKHAKESKILVHHLVHELIKDFLKYNGYEDVEREWKTYVLRLIRQRPLVFFTEQDQTLLRNGDELDDTSRWERVGQTGGLDIKDYLTYDEMQISSMLGTSVGTYFINDGNRYNRGYLDSSVQYPIEGHYVGLVGARFERAEYMESQYILVNKYSTKERGYGPVNHETETVGGRLRMIAKMFKFSPEDDSNYYFPTFEDVENKFNTVQDSGQSDFPYLKIVTWDGEKIYFNHVVYKKRMQISIEIFLWNAQRIGKELDQGVMCHIVGLGLGVWQVHDLQAKWMVEVYTQVMKKFADKLTHIKILAFSWFPSDPDTTKAFDELKEVCPQIRIGRRNPADLHGILFLRCIHLCPFVT